VTTPCHPQNALQGKLRAPSRGVSSPPLLHTRWVQSCTAEPAGDTAHAGGRTSSGRRRMVLQYLRCSCKDAALVSCSSRTAGPPGSPFHSERKATERGVLAPGVRSIRSQWLHELCKSAAVLTKRAITSCHPWRNFLTSASLHRSSSCFFPVCRRRIQAEQPGCPAESRAVRKHCGRRRRPRRRPSINVQLQHAAARWQQCLLCMARTMGRGCRSFRETAASTCCRRHRRRTSTCSSTTVRCSSPLAIYCHVAICHLTC